MRSFLASALALGVASASPYVQPDALNHYINGAAGTPIKRQASSSVEPCAVVSSLAAESSNGWIDADAAYQCLQSVPLDTEGAANQILGLQTIVDFQSTISILKDPPAGYLYPAVDIQGGLQKISDSLQSGKYTNEHDFQLDIHALVASAQDGHFRYSADILSVIYFNRLDPLYSLSKDGVSLPEIYAGRTDVDTLVASNRSYTPSPVETINGEDVETFLNELAPTVGGCQDPDANYNALFPVINCAHGCPGGNNYASNIYYSGSDTKVTFKNGSSAHLLTYAYVGEDMTGVVDGKSFFQKFCVHASASASASSGIASATSAPASLAPRAPASSAPASSAHIQSAPVSSGVPASTGPVTLSTPVSYSAVASQTGVIPEPSGFPYAWRIASDRSVACYFPKDMDDLTVISIPTFSPANTFEMADVVRQCLATANKFGKKRLMVDLRGNGGGNYLMAYDTFKQLFPDMEPWGAANIRAFDLMNDMGAVITDYYADQTVAELPNDVKFGNVFPNPLNAGEQEDINLQDFDSWADLYGPVQAYGDTFSNQIRINLSDIYQTGTGAHLPFEVSGYLNLTGVPPKQTFAAEDIVLLQDGYCASTCAVFAEFMKSEGHVGQVAVGGRKQSGAMQGVGGVKGSNDWLYDQLNDNVMVAYAQASEDAQKQFAAKYPGAEQIQYVIDRSTDAAFNFRNNIREGDTSLTPLQFVYEAADCRIFNTAPMLKDQTLLWKMAYDSYWNGGACVDGSTNQWSSEPGIGYIEASPGATKPSASASATGSGPTSTGAAGVVGIDSMAALLSGGVAAAAMLL